MTRIPADLRRLVVERAGNRCEYCGLSQEGQEATFHIDHVIPQSAGGQTVVDNLALACVSCSLGKGARSSAFDGQTQQEAPLFNPRDDQWTEHFRWEGIRAIGLTATGRASIEVLKLNRPLILGIRFEETARNRHPP